MQYRKTTFIILVILPLFCTQPTTLNNIFPINNDATLTSTPTPVNPVPLSGPITIKVKKGVMNSLILAPALITVNNPLYPLAGFNPKYKIEGLPSWASYTSNNNTINFNAPDSFNENLLLNISFSDPKSNSANISLSINPDNSQFTNQIFSLVSTNLFQKSPNTWTFAYPLYNCDSIQDLKKIYYVPNSGFLIDQSVIPWTTLIGLQKPSTSSLTNGGIVLEQTTHSTDNLLPLNPPPVQSIVSNEGQVLPIVTTQTIETSVIPNTSSVVNQTNTYVPYPMNNQYNAPHQYLFSENNSKDTLSLPNQNNHQLQVQNNISSTIPITNTIIQTNTVDTTPIPTFVPSIQDYSSWTLPTFHSTATVTNPGSSETQQSAKINTNIDNSSITSDHSSEPLLNILPSIPTTTTLSTQNTNITNHSTITPFPDSISTHHTQIQSSDHHQFLNDNLTQTQTHTSVSPSSLINNSSMSILPVVPVSTSEHQQIKSSATDPAISHSDSLQNTIPILSQQNIIPIVTPPTNSNSSQTTTSGNSTSTNNAEFDVLQLNKSPSPTPIAFSFPPSTPVEPIGLDIAHSSVTPVTITAPPVSLVPTSVGGSDSVGNITVQTAVQNDTLKNDLGVASIPTTSQAATSNVQGKNVSVSGDGKVN